MHADVIRERERACKAGRGQGRTKHSSYKGRRPMACHAPLIKDAWAVIDYPANSNDIFSRSKEGFDYRTTRDERNAG